MVRKVAGMWEGHRGVNKACSHETEAVLLSSLGLVLPTDQALKEADPKQDRSSANLKGSSSLPSLEWVVWELVVGRIFGFVNSS